MSKLQRMLPMIHRAEDVAALTRELGFLPLLDCGIPGFSVAALTDPSIWEERGDGNPWEWRYLPTSAPILSPLVSTSKRLPSLPP